VLRTDDPTDELGAAWGIEEQFRRLLRTGSLADTHEEKMRPGAYVLAAKVRETEKLGDTNCAWWPAIEVLSSALGSRWLTNGDPVAPPAPGRSGPSRSRTSTRPVRMWRPSRRASTPTAALRANVVPVFTRMLRA
jgi:hypothetical protein